MTEQEARELREENAALRRRVDELLARLERYEEPREAKAESSNRRASADAQTSGHHANGDAGWTPASADFERLYGEIKRRLISELPSDPSVMRIVTARPELRVEVERQIITVDGRSLRGRIARLIAEDFFAQARTGANVLDELLRRGADRPSNIELGNEMKALTEMGFFTKENKWYSLVPDMKVNVAER